MIDIPCVEGRNLSHYFDSALSKGLATFSLKIMPGEVVGLLGPSGSGKSTLGDLLLGLMKPQSGAVFWQGRDLSHLSRMTRRALVGRFNKLYQDPVASFPSRIPLRNIFSDLLDLTGRPPAELAKILDAVRLSPELLDRDPEKLSGGELQRLALVRVLLLQPLFLVADEPTSRLDPTAQALVARLIRHCAETTSCGVLFISHDPALLRVIADRIVSLSVQNEAGPL